MLVLDQLPKVVCCLKEWIEDKLVLQANEQLVVKGVRECVYVCTYVCMCVWDVWMRRDVVKGVWSVGPEVSSQVKERFESVESGY